jgi:hypothetical protein
MEHVCPRAADGRCSPPAAAPLGRAEGPRGSVQVQEQHEDKTEKSLAPLAFQPQEPEPTMESPTAVTGIVAHLCTCTVIAGGHLARSADCPFHASPASEPPLASIAADLTELRAAAGAFLRAWDRDERLNEVELRLRMLVKPWRGA